MMQDFMYQKLLSQKCKLSKRAVLTKFEQVSESVVCRCSSKQLLLKNSQIPQENTCVGDTFLKSCNPEDSVKKRLQHRYFPMRFTKSLRTPILQSNSSGCFWQLVLLKESRTKPSATVSDKYRIQLKKSICCYENEHSAREVIPEFFYPFILVS